MTDTKIPSGRMVVVALLGLALVLAVVASIGRPTITLRPGGPERPRSIAVLSFEALGGGPELALLGAEVTKTIHERLASASGPFEVRPLADGSAFRGIDGGIEAIARALGARYVLTGSVNESAEGIEVDVYVVFVERETRVWAERFSWPQSDDALAEIPEAVAKKVAEALQDVR